MIIFSRVYACPQSGILTNLEINVLWLLSRLRFLNDKGHSVDSSPDEFEQPRIHCKDSSWFVSREKSTVSRISYHWTPRVKSNVTKNGGKSLMNIVVMNVIVMMLMIIIRVVKVRIWCFVRIMMRVLTWWIALIVMIMIVSWIFVIVRCVIFICEKIVKSTIFKLFLGSSFGSSMNFNDFGYDFFLLHFFQVFLRFALRVIQIEDKHPPATQWNILHSFCSFKKTPKLANQASICNIIGAKYSTVSTRHLRHKMPILTVKRHNTWSA